MNNNNVEYKNIFVSMGKSLLLFVFSILFCNAATAQVDNTLQFVDASGNVVEDGATVNGVVKYVDSGDPLFSYYQVSSGLYVKNNASTATGVNVEGFISQIDNGGFQNCFPGACDAQLTQSGRFEGKASEIPANGKVPFSNEWFPANNEYGKCVVEFKLHVMDIETVETAYGPIVSYVFRAYGPSVTVNFVYDETSAGINDVDATKENKIVARYSLNGQRLSAPQKGINIVKYENGKTAKILVK